MLILQFAKLALQQGVLGQMPPPYAPAPQAFIVPQYPGNVANNRWILYRFQFQRYTIRYEMLFQRALESRHKSA